MKKVVLDTNFLFIPFSIGVDIFEEIDRIIEEKHEICILEGTIVELNRILDKERGKEKRYAKMALELIDKKKISIYIPPKEKSLKMTVDSKDIIVDDILLNLDDKDMIVATQDKDLRQRLHNSGVKTIVLRNKKYLEIR